jgi:hypothetical protein
LFVSATKKQFGRLDFFFLIPCVQSTSFAFPALNGGWNHQGFLNEKKREQLGQNEHAVVTLHLFFFVMQSS